MDWKTFVVELAKALAWPLASVGLGLTFRGALTRLLDGLRFRRLKYKEFEAEFDQKLAVAIEAKEQRPKPESSTMLPSPTATPRVLPSNELPDLIRSSPIGAVMAAWVSVAHAVRTASEATLGGTASTKSIREQIDVLHDAQVIDHPTHADLQNLLGLRNVVAHYGRDAEKLLDSVRAREFIGIATMVEREIQGGVATFKKNSPHTVTQKTEAEGQALSAGSALR